MAWADGRFLPIRGIQGGQVAVDAGFNFLHPPLQFGAGEIPVTVIDGLELAAIDGDQGLGEQTQLLAQHDELSADTADCLAIVFAEIGYGLEVRHQPPGQPHQFNVALRFLLQTPTGLNAVEIAVDVELQKNGGMVGRPTGGRRINPFEKPNLPRSSSSTYTSTTRTGLASVNVVVEQFR